MSQRETIGSFLAGVNTVAIAGHVNPDGDCICSCLSVWLYLRDNYPEINATVYVESFRDVFARLDGIDKVQKSCDPEEEVDLLILVDISSKDRIGAAKPLLAKAKKTLCFDHHITNTDTYTWIFNDPEASSTCEVIYRFLDPEKISMSCAEALYMGIAHDTGVFQYQSTSPETMRIAANLMEKGIPFNVIIDETYYQKSYAQNRIMGKTLLESELHADGRIVFGAVTREDRDTFGVTPQDMDGIISELRNTIGVEVAVFCYEREPDDWKVSLRSKNSVDVSRIAQSFGGGGHIRAAGYNMSGSLLEVKEKVLAALREAL